MTSTSLKPDIRGLQNDVVGLLEQVSQLMGRASTQLWSEDSGNDKKGKYEGYRDQVIEEARKVRNLELRMAIVAPMSAGKSTIVNAIVGQNILPNRGTAMTTLPTEIVFKANLLEPVLLIHPDTLSTLQKAYSDLENKVREQGVEWAVVQIAEYPHLQQLVKKLHGSDELGIRSEIQGHQEIVSSLTDLNDLVRLSRLLEKKDLISHLAGNPVPRIETPFWQSQSPEQTEVLGNLVIIDTPGQNEAGNFKLTTVVKDQLSKSSIVLIVLDFTQLKVEASEKVKQDVQQVVNLRGKESLYVLVNKVDQRLNDDMTPEQVRQFVAAEFGIGDSNDNNRVFEVSARFAFSAANFIQELVHSPGIDVGSMRTAETLARQVYGRKWERELKKAIESNDVEDLKDEAYWLWKDSGFDSFLDRAVNALIERAAPVCIRSALNAIQNQLIELQEQALLCNKAIAQEAGELQRQIDELEVDLERLNTCHMRLNNVSRIKDELHKKLNRTLTRLQDRAKVNLETYWSQEEYHRADFLGKRRLELGSVANWVSEKLGAKIDKSSNLIECRTEREAKEFANQAISFSKQRISGLLEVTQENTKKQIEDARCKLIEQLVAETMPIIEKARQRLNEAFEIELSLPNFSISDDLEIAAPPVKSNYRYVDQGYEVKTVKRRSFWHWVWIVPYEDTVKVKRPDKKEDYYTVSLGELIEEINRSIELHIKMISQNINKYIDEDFQERVNLFFEDLDSYLRRYQESLQKAQACNRLSQDEKKKSVAELEVLAEQAKTYTEKTCSYMQYANDILEEMK